jgi:hypothetical protein
MVQGQEQVQAKALDQELLQVLELLVQALEQVVRVTALEMEQVREQVLELALAVGLVQVPAEERVLAAVPDLVEDQELQVPESAQWAAEQVLEQFALERQALVEVEAQVEVLEPGMAPVLQELEQAQESAQDLQEPELVQALLPVH